MRHFTLGLLTVASLGAGVLPAMAGDSVTTRIEPRPYYGAVVTVENGVRVYRPLPHHDRVIINPTNAPIYLGINDRPAIVNQNAATIGRR